ncbi:nitrous oxide-stimulated promoter family protein [Spirochaetota bacterium]
MNSINSNNKTNKPDKSVNHDIDVLAEFIKIYCDNNHKNDKKVPVISKGKTGMYINDRELELCSSCKELLLYSASMRIICPYDPKPSCKKCETHCYKPQYRDKIRKVMKYSGMHAIKKGKLGLIMKYFF